jgi:hypothetical protein
MKLVNTLAVTMVALTIAGAAQASSFNNSTGLTGTFTTETFGSGTPENTAAGSLFAGLTFGPNMYTTDSYSGTFSNISGTSIANFYPCCTAVTEFSFSTIVSAAAFTFVTNEGTSTFIAKLNGTAVDSFTGPTSTSGSTNFYGFTGISFNSIEIQSGGVNNAYLIDNVQSVTAVPEPETYALMLAGLGLIGTIARRRKQALAAG